MGGYNAMIMWIAVLVVYLMVALIIYLSARYLLGRYDSGIALWLTRLAIVWPVLPLWFVVLTIIDVGAYFEDRGKRASAQ